MTDDFENHCWKDIVSSDMLEIYSHYARKVFVGAAPALLAIDLYELAYQGGAKPVAELHKAYPSSLGEYAYAAIEPTKRLFAAARGGPPSALHHARYQAGSPARPRHRHQTTECACRSHTLCDQV